MDFNIYLITALVLLVAALGFLVHLIRRYREKVMMENIENDIGKDIGFELDGEKPLENKIYGKIEVLVEGKRVGTHIIYSGETTVGRDPNRANIVVPELIVSKNHCSIYIEQGKVFIRDEKSTNGLFAGGERVSGAELKDGMTVSLGRRGIVKIIFHGMENLRNEPEL